MKYSELTVLTGDIVASSRLSTHELNSAFLTLESASSEVMRLWGHGHTRFTRFRGDGWQCLGPVPPKLLRALLYLRARLRSLGRNFDTRISAGIGPGELVEDSDLSGAAGGAFEAAGEGLDRMSHAARFAVAWSEPPTSDDFIPADSIEAVFALCDEVSRRWTPRQAEVFSIRLALDKTQTEIAEDLEITQQSVARHLTAGGDWALGQALDALEGLA
jgi:hypothetical protein